MAKACLNKLSDNITVGCKISPVGIKEIYLMHAEDVTLSFSSNYYTISGVTFAPGTRSIKVEGYKQNIQMTTSLRSMDASAKLDVSLSFKMHNKLQAPWRTLLLGRFYALIVYNDSSAAAVLAGVPSPLEVTASDFDSNAGAGLVTITLGVPEGAAGCYLTGVIESAKNTITSKSV